MNRRLLLLPLLLLACCEDQKADGRPAGPAVPDKAAGQQTGPYLWKAKGELGTVYLFGTIHIPSPKVLDLPQAVTDAIAASDIVLTELKLDRDTIAKVQTLMMLPKGETLEDVMPKEDYERIRKKAPIEGVKRMKPWAAAQNLLVMHGAKYFMTGLKPMDLTIPMNAKAAGKETGALETPEEQIAVFESLTIEEQVRMLEKTADMIVKDRKEGTDSIAKLIEVYLAGDVEAMAEFATTFGGEPDELDRKFMKALIDDRNATMKKRLLAKMKEKKGKTWFVAVGAAHHWGEKGLPALLEAEGFEVERVRGG